MTSALFKTIIEENSNQYWKCDLFSKGRSRSFKILGYIKEIKNRNKTNLASGKKDYEFEYHGKRESCVSDCSSYGNDPYCANGKTYNNKCLMYNDVCTKGIAPGTKGACGKNCSILDVEVRRSVS